MIFLAKGLFASDFSIQVNGGVLIPVSSSKGLSTSLQLNYIYTPALSFYVYSGYYAWDKYNATYKEELSGVQTRQYFTTWLADDHILIPVNAGCRINLHTNKIFTSFVNIEAGYSYLEYNSYQILKSVNPNTGEVTGYFPDKGSRQEKRENLFSVGAGAGIFHPVTEKLNLVLAFKLNSYINSHYRGLFSSRGTHTMFQLGVDYAF